MQNRHPTITNAYHFMSEAIIIFLIAIPVMYYHYQWIPYWSYLGVAVGTCVLFSVFSKRLRMYGWYILTAPFIALLFYMLDYPIIMSLIFAGLLSWRYINILSETSLSRESGYILSTILLGGALILLVNEPQIIIYAYLQFVLLIVGYVSSHLAVINKKDRKQFNYKIWVYVISAFAFGSALFFMFFDSGRYLVMKALEGIIYAVSLTFSEAAYLLRFIDITHKSQDEDLSKMGPAETPQYDQELGPSLFEIIAPYFYWGMIILASSLIILLVYRSYMRKFNGINYEGASEAVSYSDLDNRANGNKRSIGDRLKHYFNKPNHPARKMVYKFEHNATKNGYGRNPFETIEEWFSRLDLTADLAIYQKVRYGDSDVSSEEIESLKVELREAELKNDNNN